MVAIGNSVCVFVTIKDGPSRFTESRAYIHIYRCRATIAETHNILLTSQECVLKKTLYEMGSYLHA